MKELTINGKVYAKYEMEPGRLFLKMEIQIVPGSGNEQQSENLLIHLIQLIENTKFHAVGYLNV